MSPMQRLPRSPLELKCVCPGARVHRNFVEQLAYPRVKFLNGHSDKLHAELTIEHEIMSLAVNWATSRMRTS